MRGRLLLGTCLAMFVASPSQADTLAQASTACTELRDLITVLASQRDLAAGERLMELKASGQCLIIPRGIRFAVEKRSAEAACIAISGLPQCMWVTGLVRTSE